MMRHRGDMSVATALRVVVMLLLAGALGALADGLRCSVCGKQVSERYLSAGGKVYCSQACFRTTLPKCDACGRTLEGEFLTMKGKRYCNRRCAETDLPRCEICNTPLWHAVVINGHNYCERHAAGPRCCKCALPAPNGKKLPDGRIVCRTCNHGLVLTREQALRLLHVARDEVHRATGFRSDTLPHLFVVGQDVLREKGGHVTANAGLVQRGLYNRETLVTTTRTVLGRVTGQESKITEKIYIIYALTKAEFIATAAHELTHDLLAECYPDVADHAPTWVEEGICQYVSAQACLRRGYYEVMARIEDHPDRDYGDGYRFFNGHFGDGNWPAVQRWLKSTDLEALSDRPQLPERPHTDAKTAIPHPRP